MTTGQDQDHLSVLLLSFLPFCALCSAFFCSLLYPSLLYLYLYLLAFLQFPVLFSIRLCSLFYLFAVFSILPRFFFILLFSIFPCALCCASPFYMSLFSVPYFALLEFSLSHFALFFQLSCLVFILLCFFLSARFSMKLCSLLTLLCSKCKFLFLKKFLTHRYTAVESSSSREDWFNDYLHELKEEHR
jgi:hypothetical protein